MISKVEPKTPSLVFDHTRSVSQENEEESARGPLIDPTIHFNSNLVTTTSITNSFNSKYVREKERTRLRIISEEEEFGVDFLGFLDPSPSEEQEEEEDEGISEEATRILIGYDCCDDKDHHSFTTEEDCYSVLSSSSPSDVYSLLHDSTTTSSIPSPRQQQHCSILRSSPSIRDGSCIVVDPLVGGQVPELIESKSPESWIEDRVISRRNSQPVTSSLQQSESRRGSAVSLAGRSDPGICPTGSGFPCQEEEEEGEKIETTKSIEEEGQGSRTPSPPTQAVNMIMDPIETLSHVNLDTQPFGLSLSFDSFKLDSSDSSSDLTEKSVISVICEQSSARDTISNTVPLVSNVGSSSTSGVSGLRQRKRSLSSCIPVLPEKRVRKGDASAVEKTSGGTDLKHKKEEEEGSQQESEEGGDGNRRSINSSNSSGSPNDTLNTPVSKKTDGPSFFATIVTSINDPIPITGTKPITFFT